MVVPFYLPNMSCMAAEEFLCSNSVGRTWKQWKGGRGRENLPSSTVSGPIHSNRDTVTEDFLVVAASHSSAETLCSLISAVLVPPLSDLSEHLYQWAPNIIFKNVIILLSSISRTGDQILRADEETLMKKQILYVSVKPQCNSWNADCLFFFTRSSSSPSPLYNHTTEMLM